MILPGFRWPEGKRVQFSIAGDFGDRYQIDATTNLADWESVGVVTNSYGTAQVLDPTATNLPMRLYRGTLLP